MVQLMQLDDNMMETRLKDENYFHCGSYQYGTEF